MSSVSQEQVQDIIDQINGLADWMDDFCDGLEALCDEYQNPGQKVVDDLTEKYIQPLIDEKMEQLEQAINYELDRIRDKVIEVFKGQYKEMEKFMIPLKAIYDLLQLNPSSVSEIWDALKTIIEYLGSPYAKMAVSLSDVVETALDISDSLVEIASYRPTLSIPIPDIEIPTLDIHVEPITAEDITGESA